MLTVGAGIEPVEGDEDAVTGEDIVDKLLFVVRILDERDNTRFEKYLKEKGYKKKHTVGLLLQRSLK